MHKPGKPFLFQFSEQLLTSFGTFIFMISGANLLGVEVFGLVAVYWTVVQLPSVVQFSMVLLPISASKDKQVSLQENLRHAIGTSLFLWFVFLFAIPILYWGIAGGYGSLDWLSYSVIATWTLLQFSFEIVRWITIRYGNYLHLLYATVARWTFFYAILLITLTSGKFELTALSFISINLAGLLLWLSLALPRLPLKFSLENIMPKPSPKQIRAGLPQLSSSAANIAINYIMSIVLVRFFSLETLGAFNAIRVVSNIFSTISQFIDNHYSSHLAKLGKQAEVGFKYVASSIALSIVIYFAVKLLEDGVVRMLFPDDFFKYRTFLSIFVFGAAMQLFTRPLATQFRLHGEKSAFYYAVLINFLLILPLIMIFGFNEMLSTTVFFFVLSPSILLLISPLVFSSKTKNS